MDNHLDSRQMDKIVLSLVILIIQLKKILIITLINHQDQHLHLQAEDQIENHRLLHQGKMYINLEKDRKKIMLLNQKMLL